MAIDDGIEVMACTPHFMQGFYDNNSHDIRSRTAQLNDAVANAGLDIAFVTGADAHVRPDFVSCLRDGAILTLNDSRYVLVEPPHISVPKKIDELFFNIQVAGYVPILTHPERLKWIEDNYSLVEQLAQSGVWMQITAGSLTGRFGRRVQYWANRMLAEGLISILATDAHNLDKRPPQLASARDLAARELGADEAQNLVFTRPLCILNNSAADSAAPLPSGKKHTSKPASLWDRIFGGLNA